MKVVITGSLGNIGKPLTEELVQKGHSVTVISHTPERQKVIEAMGAKAAIGSIDDRLFLTDTFKGADVVFTMIVFSKYYYDLEFKPLQYAVKLANNYKQAIEDAEVKQVVQLSSIGAHTEKGNGILSVYFEVENILKKLPEDVSITFIRPVGFYNNLYGFIENIKAQNCIVANYEGDDKQPWVSPVDIASATAEEIINQSTGEKVRYVASEEISCNEIAGILGEAIGKPDLKWVAVTDEQMRDGMVAGGINSEVATGLVEMYACARSGELYEDFYLHKPELGKVKMKDFAKEFAIVYFK